MHHSSEEAHRPNSAPISEAMKELQKQLELGATHRFPEGALTETDEGEIRIAVGVTQGKVVVNFGKAIAWIGFDPRQARELAESIRKASHQAEKGGDS